MPYSDDDYYLNTAELDKKVSDKFFDLFGSRRPGEDAKANLFNFISWCENQGDVIMSDIFDLLKRARMTAFLEELSDEDFNEVLSVSF